MNRKDSALLKKLGACDDAIEWAKSVKSLSEAWSKCDRADWMTWALNNISFRDDKKIRLFACACVRETPLADGRKVWDLLTDERSRKVVEVAELYIDGFVCYIRTR